MADDTDNKLEFEINDDQDKRVQAWRDRVEKHEKEEFNQMLPDDLYQSLDPTLMGVIPEEAPIFSAFSRFQFATNVGDMSWKHYRGGEAGEVHEHTRFADVDVDFSRNPMDSAEYPQLIGSRAWQLPFEDDMLDQSKFGGQVRRSNQMTQSKQLSLWAEDTVINGSSTATIAGQTIHGLRSAETNRIRVGSGTAAANELRTGTADNWKAALDALVGQFDARRIGGPYVLIANALDVRAARRTDYNQNYLSGKVYDRVFEGYDVSEVITSYRIPRNEAALVKMDSMWFKMPMGLAPTNVMLKRNHDYDGFPFLAMMKFGFIVTQTYDGDSGIAYRFNQVTNFG